MIFEYQRNLKHNSLAKINNTILTDEERAGIIPQLGAGKLQEKQ